MVEFHSTHMHDPGPLPGTTQLPCPSLPQTTDQEVLFNRTFQPIKNSFVLLPIGEVSLVTWQSKSSAESISKAGVQNRNRGCLLPHRAVVAFFSAGTVSKLGSGRLHLSTVFIWARFSFGRSTTAQTTPAQTRCMTRNSARSRATAAAANRKLGLF